MPGIVRKGDVHVGHASYSPNPFHQGSYALGSTDVFVNGDPCQRIGDGITCGDTAAAGSSTVFANGKGVHRIGDGTSGHTSWVPNSAASGSGNVFANGQ